MALLIAVLILFVVSLLGASVVTLGQVDLSLSDNYRASTTSFHLAESGLQATVADLRADYYADLNDNWLINWVDIAANPPAVIDPFPDPAGAMINGYTLTPALVNPDPYPGTPYALGGSSAFGAGSYTRIIWLPPVVSTTGLKPTVTIRTRGTGTDPNQANPSTTTVDGVATIDLLLQTPYSTGMFFGSGSNGGDVLKGNNLRIAGSIIVSGDGNTKFKLLGSSKIANNYIGIDDLANGLGVLASKLPNLEPVDVNGEAVQTLETVLRIKDANLQMGGQASIGEPDSTGNGFKETLDALYTDDLPNGNQDIFVDTSGPYDLGADVAFPSLDAPYIDPQSGSEHSSFRAFLNSNSFSPPAVNGDLVIDQNMESFEYVDPDGKGSIGWDAETEVLTIDGVVKIDGQLKLGATGDAVEAEDVSVIKYEGTGVIWATDKIEIHKDVYPAGQYLEDGPDQDSLVDGNLGLVSSTEIEIQSGESNPNLRILATLFAEIKVAVKEPANIAGSVVTSFFEGDINGQINVWHTPKLSALAPFGLPTAAGITNIEVSISDWFQRR